jgi:hypothetical protein
MQRIFYINVNNLNSKVQKIALIKRNIQKMIDFLRKQMQRIFYINVNILNSKVIKDYYIYLE